MENPSISESCNAADSAATVLAVHGSADGYWYIGAGRSIAEGPYRSPDQLLCVAADLLAAEVHWRIDVFDVGGNKIISYSSEELKAADLNPLRYQHGWTTLSGGTAH
jgi:hypothetical protein